MVVLGGLIGAGVARAETFTVVEITDVQKKVTQEVKSAQELADLKKAIEAEAKVFQNAVEAVRKEWAAAASAAAAIKPKPGEKPAPPSPPFPGNLSPRKCMEKGNFPEKEKAQKSLEQLSKTAATAKPQQLSEAFTKAASAVQAKIDELVKAAAVPATSKK